MEAMSFVRFEVPEEREPEFTALLCRIVPKDAIVRRYIPYDRFELFCWLFESEVELLESCLPNMRNADAEISKLVDDLMNELERGGD